MMQVVYLVFVFSFPLQYEAGLSYERPNPQSYLRQCVSDILKKYFHTNKGLTLVNMDTENEEIFKILNNVGGNSISLKESHKKQHTLNEAYFIAAGDYADFIKEFPNLSKEIYWNPNARFLVMIGNLPKSILGKIFDVLLVQSVRNVLVMDESADPELYTYNPFENYGCGRRYDRIIEYGKCSMSAQENLYPPKLVTGLRNCTFSVACPNWPPYSIDPAKSNRLFGGVEEVLLEQIGRLEHFRVKFFYTDDGEEFSKIQNDVEAVGPLDMLQKRKVDVMLGGLMLTHPRAQAFHYIWSHLAYFEEISYQVKRATAVASWNITYIEFDATVWMVFILAFLIFFLIFVVLVRPRDKGRIVLNMIGFLFLAGHRIKGNFFTKYLFLHWVVLAYIINVYYTSNLVSFTNNPVMNYQVSSEEDLIRNKMQPCVSRLIKDYLASVEVNESIFKYPSKDCEGLMESTKKVSESEDLYTLAIRSLYDYNEYDFYDESGNNMIYNFKEPLTKVIYSIYFYKGFPMVERFHTQALRMRENGLIELYLRNLFREQHKRYRFQVKEKRYQLYVPWYIFLYGLVLSVLVFFVEIIVHKFFANGCRVNVIII